MFGELGKAFGKDLVDPLDKPGTRKKTYERILNFLKAVFFNEQSDEIYKGCVMSMIEILENVFPEYLDVENTTSLHQVFLNPLF